MLNGLLYLHLQTLIFIKVMIIKDLIKSSGFKQKWIAEQLGVSEITISNWVSGKFIPSKKNKEKLSKILGVSIIEIG